MGCSVAIEGGVESATIEELNAAIGPAAQTVLDAPAVEVTTLWFDEDGEHVRTDWLDYRNDNTFLLVTQSAESAEGPVDEMAIVRGLDREYCATSGPNLYCDVEAPQTNEPWTARQPREAEARAIQIPISLDLAAMAAGNAGVGAEVAVTRQQGDGGGVTWLMTSLSDGSTVTHEWTIGPDGSLRSYAEGAETGLPLGLYSKTQFDFVVVNDADPVDTPLVGSPLDIGSLGLPGDVPLFH